MTFDLLAWRRRRKPYEDFVRAIEEEGLKAELISEEPLTVSDVPRRGWLTVITTEDDN